MTSAAMTKVSTILMTDAGDVEGSTATSPAALDHSRKVPSSSPPMLAHNPRPVTHNKHSSNKLPAECRATAHHVAGDSTCC